MRCFPSAYILAETCEIDSLSPLLATRMRAIQLSAFYRAKRRTQQDEPSLIGPWEVNGPTHSAFDKTNGTFTVPRDGLYAISVQILPSDGRAPVSGDLLRHHRNQVCYVLRVVEPPENSRAGDDIVAEEIYDIGTRSFGEIMHLSKLATLAVMAMPGAKGDSLRFSVEIVQRKRKRTADFNVSSKTEQEVEDDEKRKRSNLYANEIEAVADRSAKKIKKQEDPGGIKNHDMSRRDSFNDQHSRREVGKSRDDRKNRSEEDEATTDIAWLKGFESDESGAETRE